MKLLPTPKLSREVFGFISRSAHTEEVPKNKTEQFAQCATCWKFTGVNERCLELGATTPVSAQDSCNFYSPGKPEVIKDEELEHHYSSYEVGLVRNVEVRCDHCVHYSKHECGLFKAVNEKLPEVFLCDTYVGREDCCSGWQPAKPKVGPGKMPDFGPLVSMTFFGLEP